VQAEHIQAAPLVHQGQLEYVQTPLTVYRTIQAT
jgi:hypothetical protein